MLIPWRVAMKKFKYAVVYSIALTVASIGFAPVVTFDAYGASKTQARSTTAAGAHFKKPIITTVRTPTAPKANAKASRAGGGSLYSYPVQRPKGDPVDSKVRTHQLEQSKGIIRNIRP
jgi:hypothetical protein